MPASAPANSSYMDYIMGTGYDMVPKTPEWAAPICGLPSEKIEYLAHFITDHETCYITQGYGPQRHHNGEWNAAAIAALSVITGNVGRAGTCPGLNGKGMNLNYDGGMWNSVPIGNNPVTKKISISGRFNAIDHPLEMTALTDGITGGDKLEVGIKFMVLYEAGCFGNSSSDLNWAATILEDESKCEFILGCDVIMSTSLPYCDVILPDLMYQERMNFVATTTAGSAYGFIFGKPVQEPQFECRLSYDWCADLAERLGLRDEFTEGRTWEEWMKERYETYSRPSAPHGNAPSFEEGLEMGFWRDPEPAEPYIALQPYVDDPEGRPRTTPSGKIELYSERLATIRDTWTFHNGDRDVIRPVPSYFPEIEGVEDVNDTYPLMFVEGEEPVPQPLPSHRGAPAGLPPLPLDQPHRRRGAGNRKRRHAHCLQRPRNRPDRGPRDGPHHAGRRRHAPRAQAGNGRWRRHGRQRQHAHRAPLVTHFEKLPFHGLDARSSEESLRRRHDAIRILFRLVALHGVQNLRARMQGLPRPWPGDPFSPRLRLRGRHVGKDRRRRMERSGLQLPRGRFVQPLRRTRLRGQLPHGSDAEGRGDGTREHRPAGLHRVRNLPELVPYDAPRIDANSKVSRKCDGCLAHVREGMEPLCVGACPLRALEFGPIEDLREKHGDLAQIPPLPEPTTLPNLVIGSCQAVDSDIYDLDQGYVANPLEVE